jgi:nemo like kinase
VQASSPIQQLDLITDLLGTPTLSDMRYACEAAKRHMLAKGGKPPQPSVLYTLGTSATHEAIHLLCQMLTLDPEKRISVVEALNHPYLDEGRLRYHSCMCACCHSTATGMRQYTRDFEPVAEVLFDDSWESELTCVSKVKDRLHKFIADQLNSNRVPLCINPSSAAFKSFASSTVAHPSELPPSPHHWE